MNKRYQIFVSSTYEDLIEERLEVMKALLELDCIPCGMEYFPAANEDQWTFIKKLIDTCDYYVVIVGGRYGSEDPEGISYTQKEYEYALSKEIPTIGFIHHDRTSLPPEKKDEEEEKVQKLRDFITLVRTKMCKDWHNAYELGAVVSRSLTQLMKTNPRTGWVRDNKVGSEELLVEVNSLRKANHSLKEKLLELEAAIPHRGVFEVLTTDDALVYLARNIPTARSIWNTRITPTEIPGSYPTKSISSNRYFKACQRAVSKGIIFKDVISLKWLALATELDNLCKDKKGGYLFSHLKCMSPKNLELPFKDLCIKISHAANEINKHAKVELIFDQRIGVQTDIAIAIYNFISGANDLKNISSYPYFAVSNINPVVQLADIFAYIMGKYASGEKRKFLKWYNMVKTLQWKGFFYNKQIWGFQRYDTFPDGSCKIRKKW